MNSLSDFRLTLKWLHTTKTKTINEKNNINNLIGSSNRHKRALLLVGLANMQRIPGEVCCWFSRGKTSRSKGELRFSPLPKNKHFQTPIRPGIRWTKNHFVDVLPPNHHHHYYYYYYYYYYYCCCCFLKVTFHILGDRNWAADWILKRCFFLYLGFLWQENDETIFWSYRLLAEKTNNGHLRKSSFKLKRKSL